MPFSAARFAAYSAVLFSDLSAICQQPAQARQALGQVQAAGIK